MYKGSRYTVRFIDNKTYKVLDTYTDKIMKTFATYFEAKDYSEELNFAAGYR